MPTPIPEPEQRIPVDCAGLRLDQALARLFPDYSRSLIKSLIVNGKIRLEGAVVRPRHTLRGGERLELQWTPERECHAEPQAIALEVVYEDSDILVINKPAGLVVHPGAGNPRDTLLNALLHHDPALAELPRAGIVHRLDKDTSGLMVVSRRLPAHTSLVRQLHERSVGREYVAIVRGVPIAGGTVDAPIGRHPTLRTRMAVVATGRPAVTHYRITTRFRAHAQVLARIETGRTHQIRVHLASIRYPIVGDPVYGGRALAAKGMTQSAVTALQEFKRQALHAWRLELLHPSSGQVCAWTAPLPGDMQRLLTVLETDRDQG